MGDAGYFYDAGAVGLVLFDEFGGTELVFGEGVDVGDWFAAGRLGKRLAEWREYGRGSGTLQINSTSSRSMSLTARILSLARKCRLRSLTASRRIDFWINSTLHLAFLIFLTISRR